MPARERRRLLGGLPGYHGVPWALLIFLLCFLDMRYDTDVFLGRTGVRAAKERL